MAKAWTTKRRQACIRANNGQFQDWRGGYEKEQLHKKNNNYQGIAVHIGKQYARQHHHPATIGDVIRTKTKDGSYHKGAQYYALTPHGWRKTEQYTRPSEARINEILKKARRGR